MAVPDAIQLSIATALPAYRPGEIITALLHVSTSLPEDVELNEVEVLFSGIERVDTSWVSPAYRKSVPAINSDRRRVQRHVLQSKLQAATQGTSTDGNLRRFLIRFTLPSWLPPSFKGTAVRYSYFLEAKVSYFQYDAGVVAAAAAAGTDPPPKGISTTIESRLPVQIWPRADQPSPFDSIPVSPRVDLAMLANRQAAGKLPDIFPTLFSEEYPVKCWEIGPGTAVEDAISHIKKLAAAPPGGMSPSPFSPGRLRIKQENSNNNNNSLRLSASGSGGALPSDSTSEIAHEDVQQQRTVDVEKPHRRAESSSGGLSVSWSNASETTTTTDKPTPSLLLSPPHSITTTTTVQALQAVQAEAGGAGGLRSFALRIGDAPLVRLCVHPPLMGPLQPGATVAVTLEFPPLIPPPSTPASTLLNGLKTQESSSSTNTTTTSRLKCIQVSITLETEECVEAIWRPSGKGAEAATAVSGGGGAATLRRVLEEHVEATIDAACTHFVFSLPRDITPTFQTPLVSLRWVLRFHFLAVREGQESRTEQLSWMLPLIVLSPPQGG